MIFVSGEFVHSIVAVEGTQVCTAVHTWQFIHHI